MRPLTMGVSIPPTIEIPRPLSPLFIWMDVGLPIITGFLVETSSSSLTGSNTRMGEIRAGALAVKCKKNKIGTFSMRCKHIKR